MLSDMRHLLMTARTITLTLIVLLASPRLEELGDLALQQAKLQRDIGEVEALSALVLDGELLQGSDVQQSSRTD